VKLLPLDVKTLDELTVAFATAAREDADALFVFPNFINGKHPAGIRASKASRRSLSLRPRCGPSEQQREGGGYFPRRSDFGYGCIEALNTNTEA
jgi:hypothetical protein